jgi:hypothetical protein
VAGMDAINERFRDAMARIALQASADPESGMSSLEKADLRIARARHDAEGYAAMLEVAREHGLVKEVERLQELWEGTDLAADMWEEARQQLIDGDPLPPTRRLDQEGFFEYPEE